MKYIFSEYIRSKSVGCYDTPSSKVYGDITFLVRHVVFDGGVFLLLSNVLATSAGKKFLSTIPNSC